MFEGERILFYRLEYFDIASVRKYRENLFRKEYY